MTQPYTLPVPLNPEVATRKLQEAQILVDGLSKDIQGLLNMAQMSIPLGKAVLQRFSERASQIHNLFIIDETEGTEGDHARSE